MRLCGLDQTYEYLVDVPDSVVREIASAIHVRHIQTPIRAAEPVTRATRVDEVLAHMQRHKYDATPVFPDVADGPDGVTVGPDGTVWRADLERLKAHAEVHALVRPLTSRTLIDSNATLVQLLDRFRDNHTFLLVVGGVGLDGIVTPSDMNKQAGRTHLFMQVSALELALSDLVRSGFRPDNELLGLLPDVRAVRARSRLRRKQEYDEAADLVAALDFQDLLYIEQRVRRHDAISALTSGQIQSLSGFRNRVMHAVLDPASDDSDRLKGLLGHMELIEGLLDSIENDE